MKKIFTFCLALIATLSLWADNTITYTADEKLPETTEEYSYGLHTNAFNVSITSHTFSDGIGTITFVGEVTSIGDHAFYCCSGLTSITIPNSVTSIGDYAFYCCFSLTSITIPNSVTSIGNNAFWYCSGLTSITIPNSVKVIGWYAFSDCSGLTSVTIGNSVTSIGNNAFCYCSSLTSITIPNSVTSIGDYAFYYCSSLTSITIPNSVASIGNNAFYGCTNLKLVVNLSNLYITKGSPNDGYVAYYADKVYNGLIIGDFVIKNDTILTEYIGQGGNVEIPNYVTNIGDRAFYGYTSLTSITIPNSVTVIGEAAFRGCFGLTSITIPNSVKVIGWYAFSDCSGLTSVTIGNSLTSILYSVFQGCTSLTSITIPNSVTSIGYSAFSDCTGLISITIGNSVTTIENEAFSNCTSLKSIVWDAKNCSNPTNPDQAPFYSIRSQITDFTLGEEVESVPNYLCSGMNNLASITIPNSVTVIGESAFRGCSGLTSIVWNAKDCSSPSGSDRAPFYEISSQITDFTLGKKVESVPNYLCSGMNKLTSITIPNSVTSIGTSAFSGCSGLTSITIPNSVTSISGCAFSACSGLTSITIPNSVTSIGESAFYCCSGLTSITIPNSVTSIGNNAFGYCSGLTSIVWNAKNCSSPSGSSAAPFYNVSSRITDFILGEEVESVPNYLCSGMNKLTSITIPNSVTSIGRTAFDGCSSLTSIEWNAKKCSSPSSSNQAPFYSISSQITDFTLGKEVECVPSYLCYGMNKLSMITIPNSVTSIGNYAFSGCLGLTSVYITNLAAWCAIKYSRAHDNPLYYAHHLYLNGTEIKELVIPDSITSIGDYAFVGCFGLTSIVVEQGNSKYDSRKNCNAIIETSTNTLITGCQNTVIPSSVSSIEGYAFYNCFDLTSIKIPDSVTGMGDYAFSNCLSLIELQVDAIVPPTIESNTFEKVTPSLFVYVPAESVNAYRTAQYWNQFVNIKPQALPQATLTLNADSEMGAAYGAGTYDKGSDVQIFAIDNSGYEFTGWSDGNTDNPRTITLTDNLTLTANFEKIEVAEYTINVSAINPALGTATASELVLVEAVPYPGCTFVCWSDGNFENPRYIPLIGDINLQAIFSGTPTSVAETTDKAHGIVRKVIVDGQLHIIRENRTYTVEGSVVK